MNPDVSCLHPIFSPFSVGQTAREKSQTGKKKKVKGESQSPQPPLLGVTKKKNSASQKSPGVGPVPAAPCTDLLQLGPAQRAFEDLREFLYTDLQNHPEVTRMGRAPMA